MSEDTIKGSLVPERSGDNKINRSFNGVEMQPIRTFNVSPSLPSRLEPLRKLASNLRWDWNIETKDLFRRLDPDLWAAHHHNPVLMLGLIRQERLREVAEDPGFLAQMDRAMTELADYLSDRVLGEVHRAPTWYHKTRKTGTQTQPLQEAYAYFSAEFGLVDCLPIYSGGLGVLAGDHLKSASDLGLPLVGVGLLYQKGYFSQYLNADGWQQENYPINDFYNMPLHLEHDSNGVELRISVDLPGRTVYARVWRVQVGSVPLFLLDTNIEPNNPYDQDITDTLYGGDLDLRIHQEIILGIGGVKMLRALGLKVTTFHMNEGHAAFLGLERIRQLIQDEGLSFEQAYQIAKATQVFTTHTPVPAGIDLFPPEKITYYLGHYIEALGRSREEFLALGRENTGDLTEPLSMAILAIKMASVVNGVSQLHGAVSRQMFQGLWPGLPVKEVPIQAITNGVHARSCVAPTLQGLYDRYLGPNWADAPPELALWERMDSIPDEELWRNHQRCRSELVLFIRDRLARSLRDRATSPAEVAKAQEALDPQALTIGFARRFATYKRAALLFRDVERIKKILLNAHSTGQGRPVQFIFAGKAHPKDIPGKELIRSIIHFIREHELQHQLVFIPDYDLYVSRLLVSGCDVWLNTPRRPREASGTSGMKAAMNGLPNLSVLDGWWDEADYGKTGWPIGSGEQYPDEEEQDEIEANALYDLLEQDLIPMFYERDSEGLPRRWIAKMKTAIQLNCPQFNTTRMVREYAERAYFPTSDRHIQLTANHYIAAESLAAWKARVFEHWYNIRIVQIDVVAVDAIPETVATDVKVNQVFSVKAQVHLGELSPDDVQVELYQGAIAADGEIVDGMTVLMQPQGQDNQGNTLYVADTSYPQSGLQGLSLRVLPQHTGLSSPYEMSLITWAGQEI